VRERTETRPITGEITSRKGVTRMPMPEKQLRPAGRKILPEKPSTALLLGSADVGPELSLDGKTIPIELPIPPEGRGVGHVLHAKLKPP
jgi:hypothetical protein